MGSVGIYWKMKTWINYFFMFSLCFWFVSCGENEEKGDDLGVNNTKDVAVSGGVQEMGSQYAVIMGFINVDQTTLMLVDEFGVQYSSSDNFYDYEEQATNGYTGREFTVVLGGLKPNTTYYYRTYVRTLVNKIYGETYSFTTDDIKIENKVRSLSYTRATIDTGHEQNQLFFSTKKDEKFEIYGYWDEYDNEVTTFYGYIDVKGLKPNTTYYYYTKTFVSGQEIKSDIQSFTTKALPIDLSNIVVNVSRKEDMVMMGGEDLKGLSGTLTFTITTNLASKYRFGLLAAYASGDNHFLYIIRRPDYMDYLTYADGTSSPIVLSKKYKNADDYMGREAIDSMIFLYEMNRKWGMTDDDWDEFYSLLRNIESSGATYMWPFIEIDGEQIFIGNAQKVSYKG